MFKKIILALALMPAAAFCMNLDVPRLDEFTFDFPVLVIDKLNNSENIINITLNESDLEAKRHTIKDIKNSLITLFYLDSVDLHMYNCSKNIFGEKLEE